MEKVETTESVSQEENTLKTQDSAKLSEKEILTQLSEFLDDPKHREQARKVAGFLHHLLKDREFSVQEMPKLVRGTVKQCYDQLVMLRAFGYAKIVKQGKKPYSSVWKITPTRQVLLDKVTSDIKVLEKKLDELVELKRELLKDLNLVDEVRPKLELPN